MRGIWTLPLLFGACVGVNPWWDRPDENGEETPSADNDDADDDDDSRGVDDADDDGDDGDETTAAEDGDVSSDADATSTDDGEGSSSDDAASTTEPPDPGPVCTPEQRFCDGECRDIDMDKHYCGEACVDCTEEFGNNARCDDGECEPHDDGGGNGNEN